MDHSLQQYSAPASSLPGPLDGSPHKFPPGRPLGLSPLGSPAFKPSSPGLQQPSSLPEPLPPPPLTGGAFNSNVNLPIHHASAGVGMQLSPLNPVAASSGPLPGPGTAKASLTGPPPPVLSPSKPHGEVLNRERDAAFLPTPPTGSFPESSPDYRAPAPIKTAAGTGAQNGAHAASYSGYRHPPSGSTLPRSPQDLFVPHGEALRRGTTSRSASPTHPAAAAAAEPSSPSQLTDSQKVYQPYPQFSAPTPLDPPLQMPPGSQPPASGGKQPPLQPQHAAAGGGGAAAAAIQRQQPPPQPGHKVVSVQPDLPARKQPSHPAGHAARSVGGVADANLTSYPPASVAIPSDQEAAAMTGDREAENPRALADPYDKFLEWFSTTQSGKRGWISKRLKADVEAGAQRLRYLMRLMHRVQEQAGVDIMRYTPTNMVGLRSGLQKDLPAYSLIQEQALLGKHTRTWLLSAHLSPEGTQLANVQLNHKARSDTDKLLRTPQVDDGIPNAVCTALFYLRNAENVGRTGLEGMEGMHVLSHSARLLLVRMPDGVKPRDWPTKPIRHTDDTYVPEPEQTKDTKNTFVGSCTAVPCKDVRSRHQRWIFQEEDAIVLRVPAQKRLGPPKGVRPTRESGPVTGLRDLYVYVELNTQFALTAADLEPEALSHLRNAGMPETGTHEKKGLSGVPSNPEDAARLLTELNTCFALVPVARIISADNVECQDLGASHRDRLLEEELYAGDVMSGRFFRLSDLNNCPAALRRRPVHERCTLSVVVPGAHRWHDRYPHLPACAPGLPSTCLLPADMCRAVEGYRVALARVLSEQHHYGVIAPEGALACVPAILDDPELAYIFCKMLDAAAAEDRLLQRRCDLGRHVQRLALQIGPALKMASVRGLHIANHAAWHAARHKELQALFLERDAGTNLPQRFRGLFTQFQNPDLRHEPVTIQDLALNLSENAVLATVHAY